MVEKVTMEAKEETPEICEVAKVTKWAEDVSVQSSVHGLVWYSRTKSTILKVILMSVAVLMMASVPVLVAIRSFNFYASTHVKTDEELEMVDKLVYPNVTVCHPRFFHGVRLREYNVSAKLANYITMHLDVNIESVVRDIAIVDPEYLNELKRLGNELDQKLTHLRMTLPELMTAVRLTCDDFVVFCSMHGENYHGVRKQTCCQRFFYLEPMFTSSGVCYTTNTRIEETVPFQFSSWEIWMGFKEKHDYPDFQLHLNGVKAVYRTGIIYSLGQSTLDHPMATLEKHSKLLQPDTFQKIALSKTTNDRTGLSLGHCYHDVKDQAVTDWWDLSADYTYANCLAYTLFNTDDVMDCTFYPYIKISKSSIANHRPCMPKDVIPTNPNQFKLTPVNTKNWSRCKHMCVEDEFHTKYTTGNANVTIVNTLAQQEFDEDGILTSSMALKLNFESFEVRKCIIYQDGIGTLLATVGGWFGLAFGASVISFIELFYFICVLFKRISS